MSEDNKYLVLVQNPSTKKWYLTVDSAFEEHADAVLKDLKKRKDPSPTIKICTDDYVTVNE
jgi:hypothetical protein